MAVVLAWLVKAEREQPALAGAVGGTVPSSQPPDISAMSPKERFDRLYNRVMQASESGEEAVVSQFLPMALAAYSQLDTVNADARYHLAMLLLHTGQPAPAAMVADSLLQADPGHLFGYMILGTVARWNRDDAGLTRAERDFLSHYAAEQAAKRPEYAEHQRAVEDFRLSAEGTPRPRQ